MNKKLFAIAGIIILCLAGLTSCESSKNDDELPKIELDAEQPADVSYAANQTSGEIRFTTLSAWSAYVSNSATRSDDEVDWLHLDMANGPEGESRITFRMDYNLTGTSRTAYIIVLCEDMSISVSVTQTAEEDPDIPSDINIAGMIEISCASYINEGDGYAPDGITTYNIEYVGGRPQKMIANWRDDMDHLSGDTDADDYCLTTQTFSFSWGEDEVMIHGHDFNRYFPSGKEETDNASEHFAKLTDGKVSEGWYRWMEDPMQADWTAQYDASGRLKTTRNNDASPNWDTYTFTWNNDCISRIDCTSGSYVTFTYSDPTLVNRHSQFDINWILPEEIESYDFAAGDITKIFTSCGLAGSKSRLLITEITGKDGEDTYSYRMNYKENSLDKTVVTVSCFVNGRQVSYADWEIKYINIR